MNLNAQLKVANKKNEAQSKTLEKARSALVKFEYDSRSMNGKDWGDITRLVLPNEAKVDFHLTYIPCMEQALPVIPTTTL